MRRCATRSKTSPPRSGRCSPLISPTSTVPSSPSSTCRRPSRVRFLPAIRAIPGPCAGSTWRSSRPTRRPAAARSTRRRASARRSSTSASSSATATTRSPRSAAPTSPASGSPTSSPRCCSAAASPPTSSSRPATSPTTSRCPSGGYRFYRDESLGPEFGAAMDEIFAIYSRSLERGRGVGGGALARGDEEPEGAWQRSIRAKALDLLRGLLPAATLSHVGIYATGPGLRAADHAADGLAAARGARVRRDDPRRAAAGDAELRLPGRPARPRRRVDLLPGAPARADRELGRPARPRPPRRWRATPPRSSCSTSTAPKRTCSPPACSRRRERAGDRDPRPHRRPRPRRAGRAAGGAGRRAGQPPPPPGPRLRGAPLPLRDRLRLRRLPRPAAPPDADLPVAAARPRPRRRDPRGGREAGVGGEFERALEISRGEYERLVDAGLAERLPTRSASPTGSATRSTSTPARRCT